MDFGPRAGFLLKSPWRGRLGTRPWAPPRRDRQANGPSAIVFPLEITPTEDHPWIQGAGMFRDNPLFDKWQEAISEYRRQVDQDAEAP